ncbi:MAG TPA: hypothetical protein PKI03_06005 [Pseudomonadota bacterium]|nr:hypothetical protein [Pseudomonadota bacterium]
MSPPVLARRATPLLRTLSALSLAAALTAACTGPNPDAIDPEAVAPDGDPRQEDGRRLDLANPAPADAGLPDAATPLDAASPPDASVPPSCRPAVTVAVPVPLAEIRGMTPLKIAVTATDAGGASEPHPLKIELVKADGTSLKKLFDGMAPLGAQTVDFVPGMDAGLPTGAVKVQAEIGCPTSFPVVTARAEAELTLLRLGATQILVKGGSGGGRVPLMYHAVNKRSGNYFPVPATLPTSSLRVPMTEPELDLPDGKPRPWPDKPWADLASPPVDAMGAVIETGSTLPVSLVVDSKPDLVFTVGKTAAAMTGSQPTGLATMGLPSIRLVVESVPGSDAGLVREGGQATVRLAATPVPNIGRFDADLRWHFEWKRPDGTYAPIVDTDQTVKLRYYGVLGNEQGTAAPDLPWVAVVDEATGAIAGAARDAAGARTRLVEYVYEKMALTYDRRAGASAYTRYSGSTGWETASFSLGEFLKRSRGKVVNCSDCASILSTYTNMIGARLHYAIIGWNFKLNPILGIGATMFGSPFDSGRLGFSYHAVTTPDATMTINDATLAVDGDMDPTMAPHTKLLVQDLTGVDYLLRLSPTAGTTTPIYQHKDQITHAR